MANWPSADFLRQKRRRFCLRKMADGQFAMPSKSGTTASARRNFSMLAREHGVAVVIAGDFEFPQIADVTADFVYARIMGTKEKSKIGYPAKALDQWAERAEIWAEGDTPKDLETIMPKAKSCRATSFSMSSAASRNIIRTPQWRSLSGPGKRFDRKNQSAHAIRAHYFWQHGNDRQDFGAGRGAMGRRVCA